MFSNYPHFTSMFRIPKELIFCSLIILLCCLAGQAHAQMTIRVTGNSSGCTTCDNDDREWRIGISHASGGGADAGGNDETGYENCGTARTTSYAVTHYCSRGTVNVTGTIAEYERTFQPWWHFCPTSRTNAHTIDGPGNIAGSMTISGSSSGTVNYTVQTSGNYRANAQTGQTNFTCATAWSLPANGSGTYFNANDGARHTTNCGNAWYVYDLTDPNREYLEFEPTAGGVNGSEIVGVYYGTCPTSCSVGGSGFWGNAHRVEFPKPGLYYVQVRVSKTAIIGNDDRRFYLDVRKGANLSKPANDDVCNATELSASWNFNSGNLNASSNTSNATSEDWCSTNEPDNSGEKSIWYKFTTGANPPAEFNINPTASSFNHYGHAVLYERTGNLCPGVSPSFSALTKRAESTLGIGFDFSCPKPDTEYFIQLKARNALTFGGPADGGVGMNISNSGKPVPGNDLPCNAVDLGTSSLNSTLNSGTGRVNNNFCAGSASEAAWVPSFGKNQTVWYRFNTGAVVGSTIRIQVRNDPGNHGDQIASELAVFKRSSCSAGTVTLVAQDNPIPLFGNGTEVEFCPEPNTNYWIMVDHDDFFTGAGEGYFDVRVFHNNLQAGPDHICLPANSNTPGINGFMGTINSLSNADLVLNNQTTRCATADGFEPNNTTILSGLDNTVWYRFRTPAADYPVDNSLYHIYDIVIERLGSSSSVTYPALYFYEENAATTRACPNDATDYANLTFLGRDEIDPFAIFNGGNAQLRDLCLKPNTNYYIQVDPVGGIPFFDSWVDFNVRVRKAAFRPGNELCDATEIPTSVINNLNQITNYNQNPLNQAPFFGLPHTNKCMNATTGEPNVNACAPSLCNNYNATGWYKFTTGANPPEWIEWDHNDYSFRGERGAGCLLGALYNSRIWMYSSTNNSCQYPSLKREREYDFPWEIPSASANPGIFRLHCPQPNTTYYVQVYDAEAFSITPSTCYEGLFEPRIRTAGTTSSKPVNDDPCGSIFLGTVPAGGTLAPNTVFDNFCATPTKGFVADFTQPIEADVWFTFIPPPSGSVLITAKSAPGGHPSTDDDIDLQIAIWEAIMSDGNLTPSCADPRFLWTPRVSRDHEATDYLDAGVVSLSYYDIINTQSNVLGIEGNSLIATCLDPNKMYYIQVDGGDYLLCDFFDGGDCVMGYFNLQVKDAGLYDMASMQVGGNDEPCNARNLTVNSSNTAYGSLNWTRGSNLCATGYLDPLPSAWKSADATVWYKFTAPASGKVRIRAEGINQILRRDRNNPNVNTAGLTNSDPDYHEYINLQLAVFDLTGNCLNKQALVEMASSYDGVLVENNPFNDDDYVGFGTNGFDEYMVVRCLEPGRTYYLMVDGENDPTLGLPLLTSSVKHVVGDFRISIQDFATVPASENDNICDAFEINGTQNMALNAAITTGLFNNECATIEPNIEGSGKVAEKMQGIAFSVTAKRTLWFKFQAPTSGKVKIEGINSGNDKIDIGLALYDLPGQNCAQAAGAFKVDDDYDPAIITFLEDEQITIECLVPGRYYYLQVDGANNPVACIPGSLCETGEFRIRITHLPADPRSDIPPLQIDNLCDAANLGQLNPGNTINRPNQNNRCSTEQINEPGGSGWNFSVFDEQDRTVWYRFRTGPQIGPLAPGEITIIANNPSNGPCFDLDVELFEHNGAFNFAACNTATNSNSQFNRLFKVGSGSPLSLIPGTSGFRSESLSLDCPKPNTDYFIRVTGTSTCPLFGATMGDFDLSVQMSGISLAVRENDDICPATQTAAGNMGNLPVGGTLQRNNHNNFCATQEQGEPNTSQNALQTDAEYDETMWYRFRTSGTPGEITVRLEVVLQPGFATVPSLTVYKGDVSNYNPCTRSFSGLIEVGSAIGSATLLGGVTNWTPQVTLPCPSPDWNYFVQVDGADLSLFGFTIPGYTDNFIYNLSVTDDGSGSARPINDDLANAIPVDSIAPINGQLTSGGSLAIKGHNLCATAEINEPRTSNIFTDHASALDDETVWYYFDTPEKPGVIRIRVQDDPAFPEQFAPNFALYYNNGNAPEYRITQAPSARLIQEGPSTPTIQGTSMNEFRDYTCLLPNTRYYIQIDGNNIAPGRTDQGRFIVTVSDDGSGNPGPSNDLICNAENITPALIYDGTVTLNRTNKCSWEEIGEPNTSGNMGGSGDYVTHQNYDETVWFRFRPASEGTIRIRVNSSNPSHNFILYRSSTATFDCENPQWNNLTRMSAASGSSDLTFNCLPVAWYYIQVDGNDRPSWIGSDVGPFDLVISHTSQTIPSNDMVCSAYNFGTISNTTASIANQNNFCATEELNEPQVSGVFNNQNAVGYDRTLWYRFRTPAQLGDWRIHVSNNSPFNDRISATFVLYEMTGNACNTGIPVWNNFINQYSSGIANVISGDNSLDLECFRLLPNTNYYIQVHGEDFGPYGEVGTNFTVSVTHDAESTGANDNVCSPVTLSVNAAPFTDNNLCAGTQPGEPQISPSPQNPNNSGYDETMWYRFTAPAQGYVSIRATSAEVALYVDLYELPAGSNNICTNGSPNWNALTHMGGSSSPLLERNVDMENQCLIPGRTYFVRVDGIDISVLGSDRGEYNIQVVNRHEERGINCPVSNDSPCGLSSTFDLSPFIKDDPCSNGRENFIDFQYTISPSGNGTPRIDCATRSGIGTGCKGSVNCSDYWYQFTVPSDNPGGIKIQGEDEYGSAGLNSSNLVITAYRGNPCVPGGLIQLNCDDGGITDDANFDIAVIPGETIYLQVSNKNEPSSAATPGFGLCISQQCAPKSNCTSTPNLGYGVPQCWNNDENGSNVNNGPGQYGNCLPGGAQAANYFTFQTNCGPTGNGLPDTVTVVFSVLDVGTGNTAFAIYEDATPCDGNADRTLVSCVPFGNCLGCSPSSTFSQTYILGECKTYVIQILGELDETTGFPSNNRPSNGQIYIFESNLEPPVLPVQLLSFTGYHDGEHNVLNWTTATEFNSDYFQVERSLDGQNFEALGTVSAAGSSNTPKDYRFIDVSPAIGTNYYRLKMVDIGGPFEYSKSIAIDVKGNSTSETGIVSMYPNPTTGKLNVLFSVAETKAKFNMTVVNTIGQLMKSEIYNFEKGLHTLEINASTFAQGMYLLNFINTQNGISYEGKFVKQ
jgi:hypothetical protein